MILVTVQGSIQLEAVTARAWKALVAAVKAAHGVTLTISSPAGGYRSEAMVVDMWRNPAKYGATQGTARPRSLGGPGSVHQSGRCVDIWNHAAVPRKSLVSIARKYGFIFTIPTEPWHTWQDGTVVGGGTAGSGSTPISNSDEETLMRARSKDSGTWYIIPELAPPTAITAGVSGSANHDRALAYNATFGSGFPDLTSAQIQVLLEDNATRRKGFFAEQGAAAGLDAAAISAGLARIEAELEEIKAQEAAEAATYVAEVEAALADDFAAVHANIDGQGYTVTPT
jgi:hypothetical protein